MRGLDVQPRALVCADIHFPDIHSVTVANIDAEFAYHDPVSNLTVGASDPKDCHNHPEIKRKLYSALQESDEGELSIAIPPGVSLKQSSSDSTLMGMYSDGACSSS